MIYQIETKKISSLKGVKFSTKRDVLNSIKMFDLKPPFKVVDEQKNNVTLEFITILEQEGYQFIDINQVVKNIPTNLQEVMNTYYNKIISFLGIFSMPIQLVSVKDIKSIIGFYELWNNKSITIGISKSKVIFYELTSKNICAIDSSSLKDMTKKIVIAKTVNDFVKSFKANV